MTYWGSIILTIVCKASKFLLIKNLSSKHADITRDATINLLQPLKAITHTITADNGTEFTYHEEVSKVLNLTTSVTLTHPGKEV